MTWLVTGGAGYIGAHIVRCLKESGRQVQVLDDLSIGRTDFVDPDVRLIRGSVTELRAVITALRDSDDQAVTGVVHCAGFKYAGESVKRPLHTYTNNVTGTQVLLDGMLEIGVDRLVFSSSAGVFGTPQVEVVSETTPPSPESPYGESKLIGEWIIRDVAAVSGLKHTSLRYFNVVGSGYDDLYDLSPHNLFPVVLNDLTSGKTPHIRGNDYPTPDGSCVRDYVHVHDVALAHVCAATRLEQGEKVEPIYHLGSGAGISVLEIMQAISRVTQIEFTPQVRERRPGDPARITSEGRLAGRDLDWKMRHDIDDMVRSAWRAWEKAARTGSNA
jgi:UDP-glucose 4-epimerase